jgi:hypothetical protein
VDKQDFEMGAFSINIEEEKFDAALYVDVQETSESLLDVSSYMKETFLRISVAGPSNYY